ncbi:MAG: glycosyltransferase family 39 protein [Bacteroidales bacterium]
MLRGLVTKFQNKNFLLITGLSLIILIFLYTRLPFYINYFAPRLTSDSYVYYYIAYLIKNNRIGEISKMAIEVPLGYPLLLTAFFNVSRVLVIVFQSLMFLGASIYIYSTAAKYFNEKSLFLLVILLLYFFDNSILSFEFSFHTESLFVSFTFLLLAFLINLVYSNKKKYLFLVFISIIFLALIRSNGYVYFIIPFMFLIFKQYRNKKFIAKTALGFLAVLLVLSSLNLYFKNYFFPIEKQRILSTITNKNTLLNDENKKSFGETYIKPHSTKNELVRYYLSCYYEENASFYYSALITMLNIFEDNKKSTSHWLPYQITPEIRTAILKDIKDRYVENIKKPDVSKKNYLYIIHLGNKMYFYLLRNVGVYIIVLLSFLTSVFLLFKNASLDKDKFLIITAVSFYFINILLAVFSNVSTNSRYIVTFDIFILYSFFMTIINTYTYLGVKFKTKKYK